MKTFIPKISETVQSKHATDLFQRIRRPNVFECRFHFLFPSFKTVKIRGTRIHLDPKNRKKMECKYYSTKPGI